MVEDEIMMILKYEMVIHFHIVQNKSAESEASNTKS